MGVAFVLPPYICPLEARDTMYGELTRRLFGPMVAVEGDEPW